MFFDKYFERTKREKPKLGALAYQLETVRLKFASHIQYSTNTKEDLTVGKDSDVVWASAIRLANIINLDIETINYDPTLAKYSIKRASRLQHCDRPSILLLTC